MTTTMRATGCVAVAIIDAWTITSKVLPLAGEIGGFLVADVGGRFHSASFGAKDAASSSTLMFNLLRVAPSLAVAAVKFPASEMPVSISNPQVPDAILARLHKLRVPLVSGSPLASDPSLQVGVQGVRRRQPSSTSSPIALMAFMTIVDPSVAARVQIREIKL